MIELLASIRFGPYFLTQFLGAFNDNLYKNALIILITYSLAADAKLSTDTLVNLSAGLFILPYFLFSAFAGQLADKMEKSRYIRIIKITEIVFMCIGALAFLTKNITLLLFILFCMGAQSSFFGPVKYGILPQHLSKQELVNGNGLVEMGTFLAILLGTIAGGLMIAFDNGIYLVSVAIIFFAAIGWLISTKIPLAPAVDPNLKLNFNLVAESAKIIRHIFGYRLVFFAILGISWFWFFGAVILAQFPAYTKNYLNANEEVVTLLLATFSLGIGLGSIFCGYYSKHTIRRSLRMLPAGAFGLSLFGFAVTYLEPAMVGTHAMGFSEFVTAPANLLIIATLTAMSFSGGLYIVPLYTFIQHYAPENYRSRIIAGNNILNAAFMVVAALFAIVFLNQGGTILQLFACLAFINIVVLIYSFIFIAKFRNLKTKADGLCIKS